MVEIGDKYGYIDKTGNIAIQPEFGEVGSFSEGLAVVPSTNGKGYMDKTGKIAIAPQFTFAYPFSEGLAVVQMGFQWGYIDKTGNMVTAVFNRMRYSNNNE